MPLVPSPPPYGSYLPYGGYGYGNAAYPGGYSYGDYSLPYGPYDHGFQSAYPDVDYKGNGSVHPKGNGEVGPKRKGNGEVSPKEKRRVEPDAKDRNGGASPETSGPAPARLIVSLPADARLTIDGHPTLSTSSLRVFVSPNLQPERVYFYTLEATFMLDGKVETVSKEVGVRPGEETRIDLTPARLLAAAK